ncbi:MAG: oligopeptide transporter, OPT family [Candidatus Eisenbacteria bacterium RBG_16_71_46]|nr:MAG: oligopeptide transporter, OPT family [Candidatus Eisenbacteria bacterium RBG_16_71_46]
MSRTPRPTPTAAPPAVFHSYIAPETRLPEFTPRAVILGTLLGMIFGASSLYLVLKVGLTVSASIPVAVISITLFRLAAKFGLKDASILENNIVQTAGSAGESIAFGLGVTMPAIMILGFNLELTRVMLVAILGGLLGILMMVPLRRALIVQQHGKLRYPEGTACAEVLKAGASAESRAAASAAAKEDEARGLGKGLSARTIFTGFGIGLAYKTAMVALKGWKDTPEKVFGPPFAAGSVAAEISPELLGVGYIIGPKIASVMCAGGVLAYLVLIPMIKFFGDQIAGPLPPGTIPIHDMGPNQVRGAYVLYIGAGAVAAGGIISLARSLPTIWHGLREGLRDVAMPRGAAVDPHRTDHDIPMNVVFGGIVLLVLAIMAARPLHMNVLGAVLIVVTGFLFVTVSSRLTGEIGSSSNPISGMTVATLLLTCIVFLAVGWTGGAYYVTALSVGGVVCIAASNGGATSQDLKTGYLVGATPRWQQVSILIGALFSAVMLGPILLKLNDAATVYVPIRQVAPAGLHADLASLPPGREAIRGVQARDDARAYRVWHKTDDVGGPQGKYLVDDSGNAVWLVDPGINGTYRTRPDGTEVRKFDAPKATLMSYIIKGILDRHLPWGLVLFGVMIAVILEMSNIPSLAFAVGVYLPLSSSSPIFIGGAVRWLVDRARRRELAAHRLSEDQLSAEADRSSGVLLASGYIAGGAIAGIIIAFMAGVFDRADAALTIWSRAHNPFFAGRYADLLALVPFLLLTAFLLLVGREKLMATKQP